MRTLGWALVLTGATVAILAVAWLAWAAWMQRRIETGPHDSGDIEDIDVTEGD